MRGILAYVQVTQSFVHNGNRRTYKYVYSYSQSIVRLDASDFRHEIVVAGQLLSEPIGLLDNGGQIIMLGHYFN